MPELIEVESYRQGAMAALERDISAVLAPDDWYLKGVSPTALHDALVGHRVIEWRRIGKLLLGDLSSGPTLGLRFGMTGRLIVDEAASIETLEYSSDRNDPAWDRFGLDFADGGTFRMRDPRRLGGVELDPDESQLGVEASTIGAEALAEVLSRSRTALKARLLDQSRIAGLGNLLVDETLWRCGLSPKRRCDELKRHEIDDLAAAIVSTVSDLSAKGGSHSGDLQDQRPDGDCPRCGVALRKDTVGGRTSVWCPEHQR